MRKQRERYDSEHAPVAAKSSALQQALAENERLRKKLEKVKSCLQANLHDFLKANQVMEQAGLHPFNLAIKDIDAALKELDDA